MTKGLDAILSNLTKLQVKAPNAAREAVTEVAEEFEKQLQANTPVDEKFIDHLRDDTAISGFKGASEGIISKEIGYGKQTGWRAKYPDSGTIYQRGQGFEEKTINQMTPRAKYIYAKKIKGGLGL
ncbi:HK97-gp10 family putative phage morphogenesis protein [Streptococcus gallolyticus]|uniref:HK97-gp10 family putative phage morphogenesis protein n=1 Tax=Streptococcus gallolyticus TaxID=315405 RepID=UPI0037566788